MSNFVELSKDEFRSMPESFYSILKTPKNIELNSFYLFTLHKCASTFLQRSFSEIGNYNGLVNIDIDGWRFREDYTFSPKNIEELPNLFLPKGYWYGVFRSLNIETTSISPFDLTKKSILLVRDPRDILTSLFFSVYYSHPAPGSTGKKLYESQKGRLEIDDFVLQSSQALAYIFRNYINNLLPTGNTMVFKYEDIIFDKKKLFIPALEHLELNFSNEKLDDLIDKESNVPEKENVHAHVRQVSPGDHRNKLKEDTIAKLTGRFSDILAYFGY